MTFLCVGGETLAAIKADNTKSKLTIRASIAWQLAQGREWWRSPFTMFSNRHRGTINSHPMPLTDPLIEMSREIRNNALFRPYPALNNETKASLQLVMQGWTKMYKEQAIPGILWIWAQIENPDVYKRSQERIRIDLAQVELKKIVGEDFGNAPLAYWEWYKKRVLKIKGDRGN